MTKKFIKEKVHRGGSIPFWDWTYSAYLTFENNGNKVWLNAFDIIELKKLLTMCQYFATCQSNLRPCKLDPVKEFCSLGFVGVISEGTFTPVSPQKWHCPKLLHV